MEMSFMAIRSLSLLGICAALLLCDAIPSAKAAEATWAPLVITLQPKVTTSALPSWSQGGVNVESASDSVLLPVPALAAQDEIGCFALTVVFEDQGDGGPAVEWLPAGGEQILLSGGLGESGVPLGLNARTLMLTQQMALDGGVLRVSFAGRFVRLLSVTLRPAREVTVGTIGNDQQPALILGKGESLDWNDVSGADPILQRGDRAEGMVVHAELAAESTRISQPGSDGTLEYVVPLPAVPEGSFLHADLGGLDPESWVEASINGESFGPIGVSPFSLNDSRVVFSPTGRLRVAGWRSASLFLPARVWKEGENSVSLTLHTSPGDPVGGGFLRKVSLDLLFSPAIPGPETAHLPAGDSQKLSTGTEYGNPSPSLFHIAPPATAPVGQSSPAGNLTK